MGCTGEESHKSCISSMEVHMSMEIWHWTHTTNYTSRGLLIQALDYLITRYTFLVGDILSLTLSAEFRVKVEDPITSKSYFILLFLFATCIEKKSPSLISLENRRAGINKHINQRACHKSHPLDTVIWNN